MPSTVHFADLRASLRQNIPDKIAALLKTAGLSDVVKRDDRAAVKIHFGEAGNTAFVRPVLVRRMVQEIRGCGALPYLTDTNTLYRGSRSDAVRHLDTAIANGFSYAVVGAPLFIADGILGSTGVDVEIDQKHKAAVPIAEGIADADCLVVVSHFKLHELTGFGGALKNLGMGCSTRKGKLDMHSGVSPKVDEESCILCGNCVEQCGFGAMSLGEAAAVVDEDKCVGCGECLAVCPEEAVRVRWVAATDTVMEKMAEYALGAVKDKPCIYLNVITQVSPACDCYGHADAPIVADIGMLASLDPVALDQACADLVNRAAGLPDCALKNAHAPGQDKFRDIYPDIDWEVTLKHAEAIGLGTREYEIVRLANES